MAERYQRLGDALVASGIITNLQLSLVLAAQRTSNQRMGQIVVAKGFATEEQITKLLAEQYGFPIADLAQIQPEKSALELVSYEKAIQSLALPVRIENGMLDCVIADPIDIVTADWLAATTHLKPNFSLAPTSKLAEAIHKAYGLATSRGVHNEASQLVGAPERYASARVKSGFGPGVYDALDLHLDREITLIQFQSESNDSTALEMVRRFAKSNASHFAQVFECHQTNGSNAWLAVSKFDGETLRHIIETAGTRSVSQTATLLTQIAETLSQDYVTNGAFGFLCPDNIVVTREGKPLLCPLSTSVEKYRAPEERGREFRSVKSDVFSLGTLAKACLFGANPKEDALIPSPALQLLVARATSENSVQRYENLDALISELKAVNWSALNSAPKTATE